MKTLLHRWIVDGLILGLVVFWPLNWLGFILPKALIFSGLLGVFFLGLLFQKSETFARIPRSRILGAGLFYFVLVLISTLFSIAPWASVLGLSSTMGGLLLHAVYLGAFLMGALHLPKNRRELLLKALMVANALVALHALFQWIGLDPLPNVWMEESVMGRSFSVMGNPNWLASFLLLTAPVALWGLLKYAPMDVPRPLALGSLLSLNGLALLTTGSKAGFIAAMGMGVIWGLKSWPRLGFLRKRIRKSVFGLVGVVIVFVGGFGLILNQIYPDSDQLFRSTQAREVIWSDTLELLAQRSSGYGLDTFALVYPSVLSPELWEYEDILAHVESPHQVLLELFVEIGFVGMMGFLVFVVLLLGAAFRSKRELPFYLGLGISGHLLTLLFGFEVPATGVLFWLFSGIIVVETWPRSKASLLLAPFWRSLWKGGYVVLSSALLLFFMLNVQHLRAGLVFEEANLWRSLEQFDRAFEAYHEAATRFPYDRVYLLQFAEFTLSAEDAPEEVLEEVAWALERVATLTSGQDPELPLLEAWLAADQNHRTRFEQKLAEAKTANPNSLSTYRVAALLYEQLGDARAAARELDHFRTLLPSYWDQPETEAGRIFQKNHPWVKEWLDAVEGSTD